MDVNKVNLADKLSQISGHWRPKIVAALNGQQVKLVFLGIAGRFRIEFRDRAVEVGPGEFIVVPRGVEHRTIADEEAHVLLFEPAATRNTGNVVDAVLTAPDGVTI